MLVFLDESGDSGRSFQRGSSQYFTLAAVGFETARDAADCHARLVDLQVRLGMHPRAEFHFRTDSHHRRQLVLAQRRSSRFLLSAFTIDKGLLGGASEANGKQRLYQQASVGAQAGFGDALTSAHLTLDGSRETAFQRQLGSHLKHAFGGEDRGRIAAISIQRSSSDPLLQAADYCAGVINRIVLGKIGAAGYLEALEPKLVRRTVWPQ